MRSQEAIRERLILLAIVSLVAGCGTNAGGGARQVDGSAGDGAVSRRTCTTKDKQAITASKGRPCNDSYACPEGAFCDVAAGGVCNYACLDDSQCKAGLKCGCAGQCIRTTVAAMAGCARDPLLLQSPDTFDRRCTFDDECPLGSHCDPQTGRCAFRCLADADCTGGNKCSCSGRCEISSVSVRAAPALRARPSLIELPLGGKPAPVKPDLPPRSFDLDLVSSAPGGDPHVLVEAGRFLVVQCPGATSFAKFCTAKGWKWPAEATGGSYRSTLPMTVKSSDDVPGPGDVGGGAWSVRLSSAEIGNSPVVVQVAATETGDAISPAEWVPTGQVDGSGYRGTLRITSQDGVESALAVTAVAVNGELVILDETRALSPSGLTRVKLARGGTQQQAFYVPGAGATGKLVAFTRTTDEVKKHPVTQAIAGAFELVITVSVDTGGNVRSKVTLPARVDLEPATDVKPCTTGACGAGSFCSYGFCTKESVDDGSGPFAPTVRHAKKQQWLSGVVTDYIDKGGIGAPNYICARDHVRQWFGTDPSAVLRSSGDLKCSETGAVPAAFPLLQSKDSDGFQDPRWLLKDCLDELGETAPVATAGLDVFSGLGGARYFAARRCVGLGNFFSGLRASAKYDAKLYMYLLSQWVQTHGFIARQGGEERKLDAVIDGKSDFAAPSFARASYETLLDAMEASWALLMDEAQTGILDTVLASVLIAPDYRRTFIPTGLSPPATGPWHEQTYGLPPLLLEGVISHLHLVTDYIKYEADRTYADPNAALRRAKVLARQATALRSVVIMRALAQSVFDRAKASCADKCVLDWEPRWNNAVAAYIAAFQEAATEAQLYRLGRNPLGVGEEDLPLYFGDVTGTNSKFFAGSDYLIKTQARPAVAELLGSLSAVRDAWVARRQTAVQDRQEGGQLNSRIDDLARGYGQTIIDNCGLTGIESKDAIDAVFKGRISAETCYINRDCAGQKFTDDAKLRSDLYTRLDQKAVKLQLCKLALTSSRTKVKDSLKTCIGGGTNQSALLNVIDTVTLAPQVVLTAGLPDRKMVCGGKEYSVKDLWAEQGLTIVPASEMAAAQAACEARFGYSPLPVAEIEPKCLRGQIGAAMSRVRTAKQEVNAAVAQLQTVEVQLAGKWDVCTRLMKNNTDRLAAQKTLDKFRDHWKTAKGIARDVERVTDTLGGVLSGASVGAGIGAAGGPIGMVAGGMIGGAIGFFSSGASQRQKKLDDQLRLAESEYQKILENQAREIEVVQCLHEAQALKSAMAAQVATIRTQALAVDTTLIDLENLMGTVRQRATEGAAVLERERVRGAGGFAHHFWYDEKVAKFQVELVWAKRLTYLALRVLEYELQQTLAVRKLVMEATHPDQLDQALRTLEAEQASRGINGKRPEEKSLVLSLRDDILKVADRSNAGAGERAETPRDRFAGRLAEAACAIRDRNGNFLGQGIRFTLDASTNSPGRTALPLRCAERVWRVLATIQGDVSGGRTSTAAEIQLMQMNTFGSQKCDRVVDGTNLQTASIQPSKNLFRPGATSHVVDEARTYTASSLTADFNRPLSEFASMSFLNGKSEELAGRGLYSDYVLLFPRALVETGFALDKVEDVIFRFDFLSVDDTPVF